MRRRYALVLLLLTCAVFLGAPAFEHFDHWDHFPESGQDILLTVIGVLVCLAAVVSLVRELGQVSAKQSDLLPGPAAIHGPPAQEDAFHSQSAGLQPLSLRI